MKPTLTIFLLLSLVCMIASTHAGENEKAQFEKLKSLEGEWQGTNPSGKPVKVTYEVVSNGSAVMERMQPENEPIMISMYHLDGKHLMMTHYCSAMNQPRMRAVANNGKNTIRFSIMDVTNLAKPTDGHMQKLVITVKDEDHLTALWTFVENGIEKDGPFDLKRIKRANK